MSYANVVAHNAPPLSQQPHPDLNLLNTSNPHDEVAPDVDTAHVTVVAHDFKAQPVTETTLVVENTDSEDEDEGTGNVPGSHKRKARKEKQRARERRVRAAERKIDGWAAWTKDKLFQPAVAGGIFAVVNIGVLGTVGYHVYKRPTLITNPRMNIKPLSYISAGLLTLFTLEGLAAEAYLNTAQGQEEARRAEEEGHYLYNRTKEVILRPKVAGGILGGVNLIVLGTLGYGAYTHWNDSIITRRTVSYVSVGLLTWFGLQGWAVEKYQQDGVADRYNKH
ncbi:hypothetical protein M408DRAFT_11503 [Serendipita vermifera MAFF 305830]|uniref:Uncharacterized protein n=1 Tax=Serendipita vermifera MAFF 305830 TaxID=933852 RepID=A0A0C3AFN5_SERVB|nr:hypothetical protein M408DRAFT_11503 [Serendipita vermifera MAFF 305830]